MSDIMTSLAQLQQSRATEQAQARTDETAAADTRSLAPAMTPGEQGLPAPSDTETAGAPRGEGKTLAGRVPLALHRELTRGLLDAADELQVRRVNLDEALEAAVRLILRDPEVHGRWLAEVRGVRRERREG